MNEIVHSLTLLRKFTGLAYFKLIGKVENDEQDIIAAGAKLLEEKDPLVNDLEILAVGLENSDRKVQLVKVLTCYHLFKELVHYYAAIQLLRYVELTPGRSFDGLLSLLPQELHLEEWMNVGGQLIQKKQFQKLVEDIHSGRVNTWDEVHSFYINQGEQYAQQKFFHSLAALHVVEPFDVKTQSRQVMKKLLLQSICTQEWIAQSIYDSRSKDYSNPFRSMVYENAEEMNKVIGRLDDNNFIRQQADALEAHKRSVHAILKGIN